MLKCKKYCSYNLTRHIYILSGLGADERVFRGMDFHDQDVTFVKWIPPLKNESIAQYAVRLLPQITTRRPVLAGLSFGGIMAVELARQIETERVILIASAGSRFEVPFYFRLAGKLRLHRLLPAGLLKQANPVSCWLFGAALPAEQQLLKEILADTDPAFLRWAIDKIVHWDNTLKPGNSTHIHGSADRILPLRFVCADVIIKGGGHFMTLNKAAEVSQVFRSALR